MLVLGRRISPRPETGPGGEGTWLGQSALGIPSPLHWMILVEMPA